MSKGDRLSALQVCVAGHVSCKMLLSHVRNGLDKFIKKLDYF